MIRLDKVKATAHLVNFTFATDLEVGRLVVLGDLQADGETYTATAPVAVTDKRIVIHASVPMGYAEPDFEQDFILKAGKEGRGYVPEKGDIITVTDDNFVAAPAKGDLVEPVAANTQWKISATPTGSVQAKVILKETLGGEAASVLEIL
jgi:hypothetical protein